MAQRKEWPEQNVQKPANRIHTKEKDAVGSPRGMPGAPFQSMNRMLNPVVIASAKK